MQRREFLAAEVIDTHTHFYDPAPPLRPKRSPQSSDPLAMVRLNSMPCTEMH